MTFLKSSLLFVVISLGNIHFSNAQVTAGLYSNGILTQIGIGTDPEKKFFGEGRLFAGDYINNFLGCEAVGQYNFKQSDWHNISGGLMLGYYDYDAVRIGLPVLLSVKPLENHRNFAFILEATPMFNEEFALRGNLGLRYTIGNSQ